MWVRDFNEAETVTFKDLAQKTCKAISLLRT